MANRICAPRADRILLSYPDTIGEYPKATARLVGNPVRGGFADPPSPADARESFGLVDGVPVVLVSGGSQGARTLNTAMASALPGFQGDEVQFVWMTGNADAEEARRVAEGASARAQVYAYIDDMVGACAAADLIVSRAGASSTAEIAVMEKPSILVPYPHAAENHQEQNARAFEETGAAVVLLDGACTGAALLETIRALLGDGRRLAAMGDAARSLARPGAAEAIVDEILSFVFEESEGAQ